MRIFKKVVLGLFIVIAMAIIGLVIWLQTTKPVYSGELKLNGLSAPVTIYHDDNGVPHIYGRKYAGHHYRRDRSSPEPTSRLVSVHRNRPVWSFAARSPIQ